MESKCLLLQECYRFLKCDLSSRCSNEGQAVLNAKHIIAFGTVERTDQFVKTLALCLKTSDLNDVPHEIQGSFRIDKTELEVSEMKCSCKAGESEKCKHIAAFLLLCTRSSIFEFEKFSCTDIACYWKSKKGEALDKYKPEPIKQWECVKNKIPAECGHSGIDSALVQELVCKRVPNSALALHIAKRRKIAASEVGNKISDEVPQQLQAVVNNALQSTFISSLGIDVSTFDLKSCCEKVLGSLIVNNVDVIEIAMKTKEIERWRCERRYRLTGSRCYGIFTYSKNNWENKARNYFSPKPFTNKFVEHGIEHEKNALRAYKKKNGCNTHEPGLLVCQKYPWLAYSPDAVVLDEDGKPTKLLEIKCPHIGITEPASNFGHTNKLKFLKSTPTGLIVREKNQYYGQVQLGMAILNLKETDFIVYSSSSDTFLNITVPFNEVFARNMMIKITENYFNHMIHYVCQKENEQK